MAKPTITRLPKPPNRQNSAGTFAGEADVFLGALPQFGDQTNQVADFVDQRASAAAASAQLAKTNGEAQTAAAGQKAAAAASSAQTAATQAAAAKTHADHSKSYRDSAQAAAASSQAAAGLPAVAGKGGLPLVARPDGTGVEYSSSLRKYDLDVNAATAALDLSTGQVFKVSATVARTLSFTNPPAAGRAMTVVVHITGAAKVTWPASILWNNSTVPVQGAQWTTIILVWIGDGWVGSVGARS